MQKVQVTNPKPETKNALIKEVSKLKEVAEVDAVNRAATNRKVLAEQQKEATVEQILAKLTEVIAKWPEQIRNIVEDDVLPLPTDVIKEGVTEAFGSILFRTKAAIKKREKEALRVLELDCAKDMKGAAARRQEVYVKKINPLHDKRDALLESHREIVKSIKLDHAELIKAEVKEAEEMFNKHMEPILAELQQLGEDSSKETTTIDMRHTERSSIIKGQHMALDDIVEELIDTHADRR